MPAAGESSSFTDAASSAGAVALAGKGLLLCHLLDCHALTSIKDNIDFLYSINIQAAFKVIAGHNSVLPAHEPLETPEPDTACQLMTIPYQINLNKL
jgi:hypothetical protein